MTRSWWRKSNKLENPLKTNKKKNQPKPDWVTFMKNLMIVVFSYYFNYYVNSFIQILSMICFIPVNIF